MKKRKVKKKKKKKVPLDLTKSEMLKRLKGASSGREVISLQDVMEITGIHHQITVYRWIKAGKLGAYKDFKGRYRFRPDDVREFVNRRFEVTLASGPKSIREKRIGGDTGESGAKKRRKKKKRR